MARSDDPAVAPENRSAPAGSKRAAGLGKQRPSVSIAVQVKSGSEQGKHKKPQVVGLG